jgi:hypothetical protein
MEGTTGPVVDPLSEPSAPPPWHSGHSQPAASRRKRCARAFDVAASAVGAGGAAVPQRRLVT